MARKVAALFVDPHGVYAEAPGVDLWDEARDARLYTGPHPVIAHPPCQRWGRYWHGSTRKPHQFEMGADGGCFESALRSVRKWGGVLEHPKDSHAFAAFNLNAPPSDGGWVPAGDGIGMVCCVEQGHYGHLSRKGTWLYAAWLDSYPDLVWGKSPQRIHPVALAKHGYAKARRIGIMAMVGGKDKARIRNATPEAFRDVLLGIARQAPNEEVAA